MIHHCNDIIHKKDIIKYPTYWEILIYTSQIDKLVFQKYNFVTIFDYHKAIFFYFGKTILLKVKYNFTRFVNFEQSTKIK